LSQIALTLNCGIVSLYKTGMCSYFVINKK
jgi:hypothetical protein